MYYELISKLVTNISYEGFAYLKFVSN